MRRLVRTVVLAGAALLAPVTSIAGPALLFDAESGGVFYAEDADAQWYPASLTKIMTAYVTFQAIKSGKITLESKIAVSELAYNEPPSKVGMPVGAEMTVELALKTLIVKSANDVAIMLAEGVGGSVEAFVTEMNATAARLGMTRTHFVNPNGLPAAEQVTTARDLAILSRAVLKDFPDFAPYWQMHDVKIGKRRLSTHNALLRTYEGADGLKTGFICDAGFNVVASATREGRRLMAVVLGEPSGYERAIRAASLLDHGFQVQGWKQMFGMPTLTTLPAQDIRSVVSVRDTVVAWDCGGRAKARAVARVRSQAAKAKVAKAKAGEASETGADAPKAVEAVETAAGSGDKAKPAKAKAAAVAAPATKETKSP